MSALREKLRQVQRLRSLEQNTLDATSAELSFAESALQRIRSEQDSLEKQIRDLTLLHTQPSITELQQLMCFGVQLQERLAAIGQDVDKAIEVRDEVLARVIQQKSKVRGLETFIDRLRVDIDIAHERIQSAEADDRYLQARKGN
ncbi:hypothetical protein [Stieleria varia]|uniref:Flagellar FliJ protein n=1 Tax=Stieleria varia TaxID=2528005 RepID=A0A5C6ASX8_9BACT|nr:hypothetical protein [Stieleria varia]TWU02176.1 hypothetical protein Pla52n_32250 [Stieleria varia]